MPCYHPIKLFYLNDGSHYFANVDTEYVVDHGQKHTRYRLIPCGKCEGCLIERSRQWANRMQLELKYHDAASYITLTYNDENVPKNEYVDENGEIRTVNTLRKKDFQLFMKRLRKQISPVKVRYFACGEYGDKNHRPHYHAIIFGYDFPKKVPFKTRKGYVDYRDEFLEQLWPFGYSQINEVNWNTCAYVSRYCLKKYGHVQNIYYQTLHIEPEFNLMSRRPGIGRQYYEEHKEEVYINQEIHLSNLKGAFTISPPKYFDRLYAEENPSEMMKIKMKREEEGEMRQKLILEERGMTLGEYLRDTEQSFKDRISILKRGYC